MIFVGVDPGLAATGYGVIEKERKDVRILDFGCIRTSAGGETADRLSFIYTSLCSVLTQWKPVGMAVEDVFSLPRNPRSALSLGEVRGIILLAGVQAGCKVSQLPPRTVKQALTGSGAADKEQVERALRSMTGWSEAITPNHASDALAIAVVGSSRWKSIHD
ncbi:MAG: crossover junction endodeoxyribonuclease RuvC [Armatimonadota bacterium]|nr:crossover junction endodeoxyribonuclease RuvC [Armatimonadota bacterium]